MGRQEWEGGYYHDTPRVSARNRTEQIPGERRCACGKKLTSYNRSDACFTCSARPASGLS